MAVSKAQGTLVQVKGSHLIVESLGEEVVVFDRRTNKAHLLDPRASAVWSAAENGCSVEDVIGLVEGQTIGERESLAHLAISDLKRAGLLISEVPVPQRRRLLKTLGRVAALPMVISILAPTPAAAASILDGDICIFGVDTCTGMLGYLCENAGGAPDRCCRSGRTNTLTGGDTCAVNSECCSDNCSSLMCIGNS